MGIIYWKGCIRTDMLSNRLDFADKVLDLHNYYIDSQKQRIIDEITWLEASIDDVEKLRLHLSTFLHMDRVNRLHDEAIRQLAEIRGNHLYSQISELNQQKVETKPLKIIVQELKCLGQ